MKTMQLLLERYERLPQECDSEEELHEVQEAYCEEIYNEYRRMVFESNENRAPTSLNGDGTFKFAPLSGNNPGSRRPDIQNYNAPFIANSDKVLQYFHIRGTKENMSIETIRSVLTQARSVKEFAAVFSEPQIRKYSFNKTDIPYMFLQVRDDCKMFFPHFYTNAILFAYERIYQRSANFTVDFRANRTQIFQMHDGNIAACLSHLEIKHLLK